MNDPRKPTSVGRLSTTGPTEADSARSGAGGARCRMILIRHGVTAWNLERRFQGQIDIPLSDEGFEQARRLGRRFVRHEPVAALYSSDLQRTMQTAAPVAEALALPAQPEPGLRERAFGMLEGLTIDDITRDHDEVYQRWRARDLDYAVPGGGEALGRFADRVVSVLRRLANRHRGQTIVLVTHGGVLDCVYRSTGALALTDATQRPEIPNTGVNIVEHRRERFELHGWADVHHLESVDR